MQKPIPVCALVPYPVDTAPSQRFRVEQWRKYLDEHGITMDIYPFADGELMEVLHAEGSIGRKTRAILGAAFRRLGLLKALRKYDAVVIHRAACIAGPAVLERLLPLWDRPVIFDFDDAIYFLHTTAANRYVGWLKFPGKTRTLCAISSHVIAGNQYLAEYAQRFNRNVTVIPTSIDTDRYRPGTRSSRNGTVIVGWTGSSTSQTHLEMFAPALAGMLPFDKVELRVISNRAPRLDGVPFVWRPWSAAKEVDELREFDIGIMPMPDEPWARGKCALKALQYMALGIPVVCSAVGTNREVVEHGVNGLLATTEAEWASGLDSLIRNRELRMKLGSAARQTVNQRYSGRECAASFADVIRRSVEASQKQCN